MPPLGWLGTLIDHASANSTINPQTTTSARGNSARAGAVYFEQRTEEDKAKVREAVASGIKNPENEAEIPVPSPKVIRGTHEQEMNPWTLKADSAASYHLQRIPEQRPSQKPDQSAQTIR